MSSIYREGWLHKRGEHIKTWRSRYFILKTDCNFFGYNNKPTSGEEIESPNNIFNIKDCKILTSDKPRINMFIIRCLSNEKVTVERVFAASSSQEREDWIKSIQHVSSLLKGNFIVEKSQNQSQKITLHDFEFLKILGKGTFGKVILCRERFTKRLCAMKILKKSLIIAKNEITHTETENKVMRSLKHPFITTTDRLCLVMEYVNGGELFFHLTRERKFNESKSKFYCAEICCAIGFLHENNIIYRDIKLENVLLDCDGHIKLADFGLCKMNMSHECKTNTFCGTLEYLAPEIISRDISEGGYTRAVDWWAVGVLLYEMLAGRLPFSSKPIDQSPNKKNENKDLFERILKEDIYFPIDISKSAKLILSQFLEKKASKRLGASIYDFEEIKNHSYFNNIDWNKLLNKQIEPPFKPMVKSDTDTCYFETEFTGENVQFTPPEKDKIILSSNDLYYFDSFSFYGSKASLNSRHSVVSNNKFHFDKTSQNSFKMHKIDAFDTQSLLNDPISSKKADEFLEASTKMISISSLNQTINDNAAFFNLASDAFPNIIRFTDNNGELLQSQAFYSDQHNSGLFYVSSSSSSSSSKSSICLTSQAKKTYDENKFSYRSCVNDCEMIDD